MVDLIRGLRAADIRANLAEARERIAATGRTPDEVEILTAVKYVAVQELPTLAEAGIELVGENRADALVEKMRAHPGLFRWDFIGALQSRRVPLIAPHVRMIHSLASQSALRRLAAQERADLRVLVEVNVASDPGKAGLLPEELDEFLASSPIAIEGLMTMPPLAADPEANRRHFAALRELAADHGLRELSMGTSQDFTVAVEEGATIVRLGSSLLRGRSAHRRAP